MAQTQRITHGIQSLWNDLTNNQRRLLIAAAFVVLIITLSGWLSSMAVTRELRSMEREAAHARAEKAAAVEKAAGIAKKVAAAEKEIQRLEEQRNEATERLDAAGRDTTDAKRAYDAAIDNVRSGITREQLCAELGDIGYECK